jgi:hypoxanthine phosphoribosyltransferase
MSMQTDMGHRGHVVDEETSNASRAHPSDGAKLTLLFSEEEISARVQQLGRQIREDLGNSEITLLCILKGGLMFTSDLARSITGPVIIEFLGVKSYGDDTRSSGAVQITHDLTASIEGRHVIVVEDIVDTGLTLKYLLGILSARRPASLRVCAFLEKSAGATPVRPDYVGFSVGEGFVVGYGLDWAQRLRNLPYVAVVETPAEIEP